MHIQKAKTVAALLQKLSEIQGDLELAQDQYREIVSKGNEGDRTSRSFIRSDRVRTAICHALREEKAEIEKQIEEL